MNFKYKAFISYSRKDSKYADNLFKELEKYKIPKEIKEKTSYANDKLGKIFKDKDELSAHDDYDKKIIKELNNSEFLIVICSPNSSQSKYVNDEINYFIETGRENNIIPIIIDGEPNVTIDNKIECFPEALRYDKKTNSYKNPIGIDSRKGYDKKNRIKIKIISKLLYLEFDDLWKRERRRINNAWLIKIMLCLFILILIIILYNLIDRQKKIENSSKNLTKIIINIKKLENLIKKPYLSDLEINNLKKELDKLNLEKEAIINLQNIFSQNKTNWVRETEKVLNKNGVKKAIQLIDDKSSFDNEEKELKDLSQKYFLRAQLYTLDKRFNDAKNAYEKATKLFEDIEIIEKYGIFLLFQNKINDSEEKFLKLLDIINSKKDFNEENSEKYFNTIFWLNNVYVISNKIEKGLKLNEDLVETLKNLYYLDKNKWLIKYSNSLINLANSYSNSGEIDKAIVLQKESLRISKEEYHKTKNTENGKIYYSSLINLSFSNKIIGNYNEAFNLDNENLKVIEELYFYDKDEWIDIYCYQLGIVGSAYLTLGRNHEAISIYQIQSKILEELYSKDNLFKLYDYSKNLENLIILQIKIGKINNTVLLLEELIKINKKAYLKDSIIWEQPYIKSLIKSAKFYTEINEFDKAIILYKDVLKILEKVSIHDDKWTEDYSMILKNLIYLYDTTEKIEESEKLKNELNKINKH